MQMIYNSPNYCVVEFPPQDNHLAMKAGGYEIVDKNMQREIYIDGATGGQFSRACAETDRGGTVARRSRRVSRPVRHPDEPAGDSSLIDSAIPCTVPRPSAPPHGRGFSFYAAAGAGCGAFNVAFLCGYRGAKRLGALLRKTATSVRNAPRAYPAGNRRAVHPPRTARPRPCGYNIAVT